MHRVTCKGGPLHNKSFDTPNGATSFRARGGTYRIKGSTAHWQPDAGTNDTTEAQTH